MKLYIHLGTLCLGGPPANFPVSRWASPPLTDVSMSINQCQS